MRTYQRIEKKYFKAGYKLIAGTDEAGRGPLAGPVVAAAVVFPRKVWIDGINDSKKLSLSERLDLESKIKSKALAYSVQSVNHSTINEINILNASLLAMKKAIESLGVNPDIILVDGTKLFDSQVKAEAIIDGDNKCFSIAAASILAKNHRDRLMLEYADKFPIYNFEKNKGYPTKFHIEAILKYGPCEIHRKKFLTKIYERRIEQDSFKF
ncbi:MAG: ribonuclease HII [Ignavibacteria bacterium]|nr:ribonuclease HII [Ignavibacteria bacterium]